MTYDSTEQSGHGSKPYELYSFQSTGVSFTLTPAENPITYLGQVYAPTTGTARRTSRSRRPSARLSAARPR